MSPSNPDFPHGTHAAGDHVEKCDNCSRSAPEHPVPCYCREVVKQNPDSAMMCTMCTECKAFVPRTRSEP